MASDCRVFCAWALKMCGLLAYTQQFYMAKLVILFKMTKYFFFYFKNNSVVFLFQLWLFVFRMLFVCYLCNKKLLKLQAFVVSDILVEELLFGRVVLFAVVDSCLKL